MALDFPATPSTGATYTGPNGVVWIWDGVKWTVGTQSGAYLPLSGGTLTGALNVTGGVASLGASAQLVVADQVSGPNWANFSQSGTLYWYNTATRMLLTGGGNLQITGSMTISPATGWAVLALSTQATGQRSSISLDDAGVNKWQIARNTDNSFFLYDTTHSTFALNVTATGLLQLGETGVAGVTVGGSPDPGAGNLGVAGYIFAGHGIGATAAGIEIGQSRTANGGAFLDFHGVVGTDYDARLIRAANTNGALQLENVGAGIFSVVLNGVTRLSLDTANVALVTEHWYASADNVYLMGDATHRWAAVYSANGTIQTSDARGKVEVAPSDLGLDFVLALKPVSYRWEIGGQVETGTGEDGALTYDPVPGKRRHYGLVAQDVKAVLGETDFGGWVLTDTADPDSQQALRYDQFIAPLIAAVQQQQAQIVSLESRLAVLEGAGP